MIYLFNSGFQPLYRTNVRRTMFLPSWVANEYRYKASGERRNINPQIIAKLQTEVPGAKVAIIFIDKFAGNSYRFIPLRLASFLKAWPDGERFHIATQLKDFIQAKDLIAFNQKIVEILGDCGLPKMESAGSNINDGEYVIEGLDIFQDVTGYEIGPPAWDLTVEQLYETKVFKEAEEGPQLFSRCRLRTKRDEHELEKVSISGANTYLELTRGSDYVANLYYKVGIPALKKMGLRIELRSEDEVSIAKPRSLIVDADSNSMQICVKPKKYAEEPVGSFEFIMYKGNEEVSDSSISIPFKIKTKKIIWLWMFLCMVLFALCSAFKSYDFSKHLQAAISLPSVTSMQSSGWLGSFLDWIAPLAFPARVFAEFIQVVVIIAMIRLFGKKPI